MQIKRHQPPQRLFERRREPAPPRTREPQAHAAQAKPDAPPAPARGTPSDAALPGEVSLAALVSELSDLYASFGSESEFSTLLDAPVSSEESPLLDPPVSSDDSPLLDPTPEPTPAPKPEQKADGPVVVVGNLKRSRTVRSFLAVMQQRGIELPFDPATLDPAVLDRKVKAGHSLVLSCTGEILGTKKTQDVKGDKNLGVGRHGDNFGNKKLSKEKRTETHGTGGDVEVGGKTYEAAHTFLKSPIMLDLNGDGALGTTGNSTAKARIDDHVGPTVRFDVDGDGVEEATEWMDGLGDGMLVDDSDGGATTAAAGDGRIDGTRLFGDQGGRYANGYEKLARHDRDGDGHLTGAELESLKVWVDDGDARVEAGELQSLAELGVSQLSTQMHLEQNARGEALMRSSFVRDGQTHVSEDVWFASRQ